MGAAIERIVIRPVEDAPVLNVVVVTLGLFLLLNSVAIWIWAQGELPKVFPTPFGFESANLGIAKVSQHHVGLLAIAGLLGPCVPVRKRRDQQYR